MSIVQPARVSLSPIETYGSRRSVLEVGDLLWLDRTIFPSDDRVQPHEASWYLLRSRGEPVAFGGVLTGEGEAFFVRGGVLPEFRGRGLYKRIVRHAERLARAEGCETIWTYVLAWNAASINALISCGWRAYQRERGHADCVYLGRTL